MHIILECRAGNNITWKLGNKKADLGAIIDVLKAKAPKDTLTKGMIPHGNKILHRYLEN